MARRREKIPHRKKARQLLTGTFRVVRSGQASVETPEGAVLTREGNLTGRMDFSPGERNTFLYETPYGSATVCLETKRYTSTLTERGGTLEIEYVIDFDHAFVALNRMRIQVTEKKEY